MNTLTFSANASRETNDHQVRPIVDGVDWLGNDHLGLDPPTFFRQPSLQLGGELLIGRCKCGVIGCDDRFVEVDRDVKYVSWRSGTDHTLQFVTAEYDRELERARNDFTWENVGRTAERLVGNALEESSTSDGYVFSWSSTRIRTGIMTLCFERNGEQKLVDIPWNGVADDAIVSAAHHAIP